MSWKKLIFMVIKKRFSWLLSSKLFFLFKVFDGHVTIERGIFNNPQRLYLADHFLTAKAICVEGLRSID